MDTLTIDTANTELHQFEVVERDASKRSMEKAPSPRAAVWCHASKRGIQYVWQACGPRWAWEVKDSSGQDVAVVKSSDVRSMFHMAQENFSYVAKRLERVWIPILPDGHEFEHLDYTVARLALLDLRVLTMPDEQYLFRKFVDEHLATLDLNKFNQGQAECPHPYFRPIVDYARQRQNFGFLLQELEGLGLSFDTQDLTMRRTLMLCYLNLPAVSLCEFQKQYADDIRRVFKGDGLPLFLVPIQNQFG